MYNGNVGGVSGNGNTQWNKSLAEKLDAADGKKDGYIDVSVWNNFIDKMGSKGNKINSQISVDNAAKSINFYQNKKDVGQNLNTAWKDVDDKFIEDFKNENKDKIKPSDVNRTYGSSTSSTNSTTSAQDTESTTSGKPAKEVKKENLRQTDCKGVYYDEKTKTHYKEVDGKMVEFKAPNGAKVVQVNKDGSYFSRYNDKDGAYSSDKWRPNGTMASSVWFDKSGKKIQSDMYDENGVCRKFIIYDPKTGNKAQVTEYDENGRKSGGRVSNSSPLDTKYTIDYQKHIVTFTKKDGSQYYYKCDEKGNSLYKCDKNGNKIK